MAACAGGVPPGDVEAALNLVPSSATVLPPVRRPGSATAQQCAAAVTADGSAPRIFADFPVLLELCTANLRAMDALSGGTEASGVASPGASAPHGLAKLVRWTRGGAFAVLSLLF